MGLGCNCGRPVTYPSSLCPGGVLETFSLDQGQWNYIFIYLVQPSVALCPFRCTLFGGDKKGQTSRQASLPSVVMFRCTSIDEQCPRVSNRSRRPNKPSAIYDTYRSPLSPLSPFFLLTSGAPSLPLNRMHVMMMTLMDSTQRLVNN